MRLPLGLLGASLLLALGAFVWAGPDTALIPVLAAVAALVLVVFPQPNAGTAKPHVIVDGSNVLFWNGGAPALETVDAVVQDLLARGFMPGVIFDANVGYKIGSRYLDDAELARRLGLPDNRVLVVPRGTVADTVILSAARRIKAKVVTNDRYRDWAQDFPEIREPGFLIRGGLRNGLVRVDLDAAERAA